MVVIHNTQQPNRRLLQMQHLTSQMILKTTKQYAKNTWIRMSSKVYFWNHVLRFQFQLASCTTTTDFVSQKRRFENCLYMNYMKPKVYIGSHENYCWNYFKILLEEKGRNYHQLRPTMRGIPKCNSFNPERFELLQPLKFYTEKWALSTIRFIKPLPRLKKWGTGAFVVWYRLSKIIHVVSFPKDPSPREATQLILNRIYKYRVLPPVINCGTDPFCWAIFGVYYFTSYKQRGRQHLHIIPIHPAKQKFSIEN